MTLFYLKSKALVLSIFCIRFFISSAGLDGDNEIGGRIINGTLASLEHTKHQVSIRKRSSDNFSFGAGHICGGSLILPNVVLTAAHCFVDQWIKNGPYRPNSEFVVVLGTLNRFQRNENTLQFDIERIVYGIVPFNSNTYQDDIAVVFLNGSVPLGHPTIKPIERARTAAAAGTICQATGWGRTESQTLATKLLTVNLPIIGFNNCIRESNFGQGLVREGMICAGYMNSEHDTCDGDSGGPLVCNNKLNGVVSWGIGCALPRLPGVYTDVAYWSRWIDDVTEENTTEITSIPPTITTTPGNSTGSSTGSNSSPSPGTGGGAISNFSHSAVMLTMFITWATLLSYFNEM